MSLDKIDEIMMHDGYIRNYTPARERLFIFNKKNVMRRSMRKAGLSPAAFNKWVEETRK